MDMSVIIPARNEEWLAQTIDSILANARAETEVIAILDGYWPEPGIIDHPKVTLIHHTTSIGQRAACNEGVRYSRAKYIMKLDAHCSVDEGFDVKLMQDCEYDWTVVPRMYNLHVFNWLCKKCSNETYQGPKPTKCEKCDNTTDFERKVIYKPRLSRMSDFARFDSTLHFQYWGDCGRRPESQGDIADLMCCVGAGWMMHRDRYWDIGGMDEAHGSWGQMGVELACKSWLSGGRQVVNKKTWFSHLFRTQPGFGFPYPNPGIERAREHSRKLWFGGEWPKAKYPLSWLIEKFSPVPDWPDVSKSTTRGLVYYTDNRCPEHIADVSRRNTRYASKDYPIVSVSLKPIEFGKNIVFPGERGILTMFKQILAGIEACDSDIVFLIEHDMLYHPSHFDFIPPRDDVYYYNENTYKVDAATGQALFYYTKQTSGCCARKELLREHYSKRVEKVEKDGFSRHMGFEPGCHAFPRGVDNYKAERWMSKFPNIDIRHTTNLTASRWSQDQFRSQRSCQGWILTDEVPGWGVTKGRFDEFIKELPCNVTK